MTKDRDVTPEFILALAEATASEGLSVLRRVWDADQARFRKMFTRFANRRRIGSTLTEEHLAKIQQRLAAALHEEARCMMH